MKKINISICSLICVLFLSLCFAFALSTENSAGAETTAGIIPTFSVSKYKISSEKDGLLIATGIKDYQDVYEIGYEIDGEYTAANCSTSLCYSSITSGDNVWSAADLFGSDFSEMLVWEIEYDRSLDYNFTAYAKVGARDKDSGELVYDALNENVVFGTLKTALTKEKSVTVSFNMDGGALSYGENENITSIDVVCWSRASFLGDYVKFKDGYYFGGFYVGEEEFDLSGRFTEDVNLTAKWYKSSSAFTVNDTVKAYLDDSYENIDNYVTDYSSSMVDTSKPYPVVFDWSDMLGDKTFKKYTLHVATDKYFNNAVTFSTTETSYELYNLFVGSAYYWKVTADGFFSDVNVLLTDENAPRLINVDGVTNIRDLGGYYVQGGRTAQGLIYRSANLDGVSYYGNFTAKNVLGIKTEIDLRGDDEGARSDSEGLGTGYLGNGVNYYTAPLRANFTNSYNSEWIIKIFDILSDRNNYPVVFHCVAGADRTGFLGYVINALLGVEKEQLFDDYQITNFAKRPERDRYYNTISHYVDAIDAKNGATLAEKTFNYLAENVGVDSEKLLAVISIMTEDRNVDFISFMSPAKDVTFVCDEEVVSIKRVLSGDTVSPYVLGCATVWKLDGVEFDFSKPVTSDITLYGEIADTPLDFSDSDCLNYIYGGTLKTVINKSSIEQGAHGLEIGWNDRANAGGDGNVAAIIGPRAITINFYRTLPAGTIVDFDFGILIPSKKDLDVGNNYTSIFDVKTGTELWRDWTFSGFMWKRSFSLTENADHVDLGIEPFNLRHTITDWTNDLWNEFTVYIDNIVISEPLPAKTAFDFESAKDLNYVVSSNGSAEIIDISDMIVGSTSCSINGNASGKVLQVTNSDTTVTINFGKTVAAGTTVELDFALVVPSKKDLCAGSNYVAVSISGQSYNYWHFDGKFKHPTVTLSSATDKITFSFGLNNLSYTIGKITPEIKAETIIYLDNLVVTEP